eukprot:754241-Hanusia_phi.AAC.3
MDSLGAFKMSATRHQEAPRPARPRPGRRPAAAETPSETPPTRIPCGTGSKPSHWDLVGICRDSGAFSVSNLMAHPIPAQSGPPSARDRTLPGRPPFKKFLPYYGTTVSQIAQSDIHA